MSSAAADNEAEVIVGKVFSVAALIYLFYIMVTCPCRPQLYKCHLTSIYVSLAILVLVIIYFNGLRFTSYH